jgi:hypothetical protein
MLALVGAANQPPDCSAVTATPSTLSQMRDQMALISLSGATDANGDTLSYRIDGVTQDEYVTGVGDDTFPDAALTAAGANSNQVLLRSEANPQFNGGVYRIAYTVSDGQAGNLNTSPGSSSSYRFWIIRGSPFGRLEAVGPDAKRRGQGSDSPLSGSASAKPELARCALREAVVLPRVRRGLNLRHGLPC